ncbi:MAG TPA: ATP-binding protein [Bacillota bacterium]|nr:ATP-binding protein [Bacillota bacterium]
MNSVPSTFQNLNTTAPRNGCPECDYQGYIKTGPNTVRLCRCREQGRIEKLFECSRISPAFRMKNFDNFETENRPATVQAMARAARNYANNFKELKKAKVNNWLVLLGEPGSGKTHLSLAVGNQLINEFTPVLYFQHVEGISELMTILKKDEESIGEKLSEMKRAEFLIWDDLFKPWGESKQPKSFEIRIAFEVLNFRYLNLMPTAINSEHLPDELLMIDRAIGSRILERSKGHLVTINGIENNYRLL